jgi:hypothetical protein
MSLSAVLPGSNEASPPVKPKMTAFKSKISRLSRLFKFRYFFLSLVFYSLLNGKTRAFFPLIALYFNKFFFKNFPP